MTNKRVASMRSLVRAIEKRDLAKILRLLSAEPELFEEEISFGWPVMHTCLADSAEKACADLALTRLFVERGGDVNHRADQDVSLLFLAQLNTPPLAPEIAKYLQDRKGTTSTFESAALSICTGGDAEAFQKLTVILDQQPGLVRHPGHHGWTLLHYAARAWKEKVVRMLLERGADPNAITYEGDTPLLLTRRGESVLALHEKVASENITWRRELSDRAESLYGLAEAVVHKLMEGKSDAAIEDFRRTPELVHAWYPPSGQLLHCAAWRGRQVEPVLKYMLENGADPNARGENGRTPLHYLLDRGFAAKRAETLDLIRLFVKHGADPNRRDKNGWAPIHKPLGWDEAIKLLIELGADVNAGIGGPGGETILDLVRERDWDDRQFANWLKKKGALSGKTLV